MLVAPMPSPEPRWSSKVLGAAVALLAAIMVTGVLADQPISKPGSGQSQIIGPDNQTPVNNAPPQWRARRHPVVRIVVAGGGCGTGFLIDDNCVLTCAHVVQSAVNSSTSVPAGNITVQFGYEDNAAPFNKGAGGCGNDPNCAAPDDWTAASSTILSPANVKDCAVIRLNPKAGAPAGATYGRVTVREAVTVGEAVHVIGHPDGRCKEYSNDAAAVVIQDPDNGTPGGGTGPGWISHGADTEVGSSGSPVFAADGCVIAKHCGADSFHGTPRNYAMKISAVRASAESLGCSFSIWRQVPGESNFGLVLLALALILLGSWTLARRQRAALQ